MTKLRREARHRSLLSVIIVGLFFGALFVSFVPMEVSADNPPEHQGGGVWENEEANPDIWEVTDPQLFTSHSVHNPNWDYCTQMTIYSGIIITTTGTLVLEGVDLIIDVGLNPFIFEIESGGKLILNGTGDKSTTITEADGNYYPLNVGGTLEIIGDSPSSHVEINNVGGETQGIVFASESTGIVENCTIKDVEDQAISCGPTADISFDGVHIIYGGSTEPFLPGVSIDGSTITKFNNTLIEIEDPDEDTEAAIKFSNIPGDANVEIHNCTFKSNNTGEGSFIGPDLKAVSSEIHFYNCKFSGDGYFRVHASSSSALHVYAPIVKMPSPLPQEFFEFNIFLDTTSELLQYWFLNTTVVNHEMNGINGVKIIANSTGPDTGGPQNRIGYTDADGKLFWFPLQQKRFYNNLEMVMMEIYEEYDVVLPYGEGSFSRVKMNNEQNGPPDEPDYNEIDVDEIRVIFDTRPDLLTNAYHDPYEPYKGDNVTINVTIDNVGMTETLADITLYEDTPVPENALNWSNGTFIDKGSSTLVTFYWNTTGVTTGFHTFWITADNRKIHGPGYNGEKDWEDLNPNNCTWEINVKVPGPDFLVTEFSPTITEMIIFNDTLDKRITYATDGDIVKISANITNVGHLMGSAIVRFYNDSEEDGVLTTDHFEEIGNIPITDMESGDFQMLSILWDTKDVANSSTTQEIWVRITDVNPEEEEATNNEIFTTFEVRKYYDFTFEIDGSDHLYVIYPKIQTATYTLNITNTGRANDDIITLSTNIIEAYPDQSDWSVHFQAKPPGVDITIDNLEIGAYVPKFLVVEISEELTGGDYIIANVTATSSGNSSQTREISTNTSYGQPDLIPTTITPKRADGKSGKKLIVNETATISVEVSNFENAGTGENFLVNFTIKDETYVVVYSKEVSIDGIDASSMKETFITWKPTKIGNYHINITVDPTSILHPNGLIDEINENNNQKNGTFTVKSEIPDNHFTLTGYVRDMDWKPVDNAQIRFENKGKWYNTTYSKSDGSYIFNMNSGNYEEGDEIIIEAFYKPPNPDPSKCLEYIYAYSEDSPIEQFNLFLKIEGVDLHITNESIKFYREKDGAETNEPIFGENTTITVTIQNRGTENATNYYVNFTYDSSIPIKNGFKVPIKVLNARSTDIIPKPPNYVIWWDKKTEQPSAGIHTVKVEISNFDVYHGNNIAFRTVRVKDKTPDTSLYIFGTIYESDGRTPVPKADVSITNLNPKIDLKDTTKADSLGRYYYWLSKNKYEEGDEIEITATGESGSGTQNIYAYSEDQEVRVDIMFDKYEVRVEISPLSNETNHNLKAQYTATVTNVGTKTDTITLSIPDIPTGWIAVLWNQDTGDSGETITIENLESKKSQKITVNVTAIEEKAGIKYTMILNASSEEHGIYDIVEFTTEIGVIYRGPTLTLIGSGSKSAEPGQSESYNMTVTNLGNANDYIQFVLSDDYGWAYPIESVLLCPNGYSGDSTDITLMVTVPKDAREGKAGTVTVTAKSIYSGLERSSVSTTTTADKKNEVPSISVTPSVGNTYPGLPAEYTVRVTNNGNGVSDITITKGVSNTWTISYPSQIDDVGSGQTKQFTLTVTPLTGALAGDSETVTLTASVGGFITDPVSTVTTVNYDYQDPKIEFVDGDSPTVTLIQGETKSYTLKITNNGNFKDTMFSTLGGEVSWASFIPPISINAWDEKIVELLITVPTDEISGKKATIKINATSGISGRPSNNLGITITVEQGYNVEISTDNSNNEINPGESCVYNIDVKNTGKLKDNYMLKVNEVSENKWNLEQDLISVGSIGVGNTTTVKVLVRAPKDASFEDNKIKVFAISQTDTSVISNEIELKTKLHQPPDSGEIIIEDEKKLYTNKDIMFSVVNNLYTYTWDFNDGTDLQSGAITTHTFSQTGTYKVTVTAKDDFGAEGESTKSITVSNKKPDVQISKPKSNIKVGINEKIKFEGNVSDSNGIVEYITWDFGDGTKKIEKISKDKFVTTAEHSYSDDATFTITLTTEDDLGAEEIYSITIIVENQAPNATFSIREDTVFETDKEIEFDGSLCYDPDNSIIRYEWDFGDGTTGVGMNVTHIYSKEDSYYVTLTVTDENGETNTYSKTIEINKPEEKSYTIHWFGFITMIAVFSLILIAILFGGREEFFSHINSSVKDGLAEKKAKEAKPKPVVMPEIEDKLKKLEIMVKERTRLPPPMQIETPAGILEEIREPEVKDLTEVKEVEDEGLLEEVTEGEEEIEEELKKPGSIDELSEAFAATLVNLAKSRDELAKVEERIADSLKEERNNRAAEIRKITQDYELTQRKIDALDSMAKMRRMQAGEEKIAAIFRGEVPEEGEYGGLEEIEEAPLGELEEIEEESFGELEEIEEEEEEIEEELEEDEELLEELEDLEEEETTEEGEMAECGACGAMIPVSATKCPKCGAEFEEE